MGKYFYDIGKIIPYTLFLLTSFAVSCVEGNGQANQRTDAEKIMDLVLNQAVLDWYAPGDSLAVRVKSIPSLGTNLQILQGHREVVFFI